MPSQKITRFFKYSSDYSFSVCMYVFNFHNNVVYLYTHTNQVYTTLHFSQEMEDSFTSALQRAICDRLAMCSQGSDIGLRDSTITCSNPDSKFGIFSATMDGSNAAKIVENIRGFDDFVVNLGDGPSLSLTTCVKEMCITPLKQQGKGQSSGLVAGVVISVIFLVAMVIAAAILMTVIIFKYR